MRVAWARQFLACQRARARDIQTAALSITPNIRACQPTAAHRKDRQSDTHASGKIDEER